jgi:hypothetical protein
MLNSISVVLGSSEEISQELTNLNIEIISTRSIISTKIFVKIRDLVNISIGRLCMD